MIKGDRKALLKFNSSIVKVNDYNTLILNIVASIKRLKTAHYNLC